MATNRQLKVHRKKMMSNGDEERETNKFEQKQLLRSVANC